MIITISGRQGAGKTTCAKLLSQRLGFPHYSIGDMRGKLAIERGMTIDEFNQIKDPKIHTQVDEFQKRLGEKEDHFITEGWMSWYFIPHSLKIFLDVNEDVGVKRIFNSERDKDEPKYKDLEDCKKILKERFNVTRDATMKLYNGADLADKKNYDFIIDTTKLTPEEVVERVMIEVKKH